MNTETQLTAQQSIEVIEKMIRANNERMERNSAIPFLIWGYTTVLVGLLVFFLLPTMGLKANYFWLLIPVLGIIASFTIIGRMPKEKVQGSQLTHRFINVLWIVLGINCLLCSFLGTDLVLTLVTVIIGSGAVITAFTLGFKSMKVTSILGVLIGYLLVFMDFGRYEVLIFAAAFMMMFVIPGHYLLHKNSKSHGRK